MERQWPQLKGQFLIDREGIVRWANIECAGEGLAGVGKFPTDAEILTARSARFPGKQGELGDLPAIRSRSRSAIQ